MTILKRYLLFEFGYWYPSGGMNDLDGSFDSWEDINAYFNDEYGYGAGEYHILDRVEGVIFEYSPVKEEWCKRE